MPMIRITKRTIEAIETPAAGQVLYRDTELRGFGLRVGRRDRSYFVERQVRRRTVRTTIGRCDLLTPEQARKEAMRLLSQMADGRDLNAERAARLAGQVTLQQAFDQFFDGRPHLSPSTIPNYRRTVRVYLSDWQSMPVNEITRRMVLDRHRELTAERGPITANNAMRHLRSVYNFTAATNDNLPPNPVIILTQARAWHPQRRRRTLIAEHQLPKWFEAVQQAEEHVRDFLLIAIFTGMRRSEVARLRWENIDLDGRTLLVPRTKNGEPLELPLSDHLHGLLLARREMFQDAEWVFPGSGQTGHIIETKRFYARVERVGGVSFTLHDLRRTFVTIAESLDIPAYALKRLLNHRTDSDVTGGYIVISVERLRGPVERIAQRILEVAKVAPPRSEACGVVDP